MPISNIGWRPELNIGELGEQQKPAAAGLGDQFKELLAKVNTEMAKADTAAEAFAAGETDDIHGTMMALERATISFRMIGSIRNKVLEAYQETMRMGM